MLTSITRAPALLGLVVLTTLLSFTIGCDSSSDARPEAPVIDTIPPTIPAGLAGSMVTDEVHLTWDANVTDPDLAGYIVYRSESQVDGYRAITADAITTNSWSDEAIQEDRTYYYRVSAIDSSNNESGLSVWFGVGFPSPTPRIGAN